MPKDRDKPEIKVTDRRLFTAEGELRPDAPEEEAREERKPEQPAPPVPPIEGPTGTIHAAAQPVTPPAAHAAIAEGEPEYPEPPSAAEQQQSRDAFSAAGAKLDDAMSKALGAQHRPEQFQVTFENFIASLYMSGMFQLGMLREEGQQPQVDLVGARHTIDTISMLEEKTRGNLTDNEKAVLQDCLFRLRMAFVEITNVLTRPPAPGEMKPKQS